MAPPKKLSIPIEILRKLDAQKPTTSTGGKGSTKQVSRKEQRKAQRIEKKQKQSAPQQVKQVKSQEPPRSNPANVKQQYRKQPANEDWGRVVNADDLDDDSVSDLDGNGSDDGASEMGDEGSQEAPASSKAEKRKSMPEDAEIAALERKLGLKRGKKSKAIDEDGLGDLLDGLEGESDDGEAPAKGKHKRKAEADDNWLAQKRRKANNAAAAAAASRAAAMEEDDESHDSEYDEDDNKNDGFSDLAISDFDDDDTDGDLGSSRDEDDDGGFDGFSDSDDDEERNSAEYPAPHERENPYVAPTTGVAKYVPPSLRQQSGSNEEVDAQLRRRVQGLINRLTNESMVGIIKDLSGLYDNFPRQSVTSTLIDLVISLVCSPEKRPDGFFTMIAGFASGCQRALGTHVAANLLQRLVEVFKEHHNRASGDHSDSASKHMISLLAELYNMQVIGPNLMFDYIRLFLANLDELNTELLLRIVNICGPSLRRDDPHSLKDIVNQMNPSNFKNISIRTSFMLEEMKKLHNNKSKAAGRNKDIAEQRTQIRKRIGILQGHSDSQPLRVGLKEIENADKYGKWWVVGASWSGNRENDPGQKDSDATKGPDDVSDLGDDDFFGIPDLWQLAREQGFNTDVRQRIFVALHAATDFENAELLIRKLRLNKHQRKEVPEVIVRSGERQGIYNRYYFLVATRFCGDRELGFQFRRSLTTRFRKMGEDIDTGDNDYNDGDDEEDYESRWLYNVARFYGSLVANRNLGLDILKYRNLAALREKSQLFVEVLLITVLKESKSETLQKIFGSLETDLARSVQYFLKKYIRKTDLLEKEEKRLVKKKCQEAAGVLEASLSAAATE
ncbi:uncharacterized protein BCR38DRAFT_150636 [Pseudomassariella vexata]|uniref:MI domain-containing protein n=1 Tax=Pseudomassariella vexata TaxID=1141098 RepID=A0A1Y2E683_9PEZI|nr:uncharacterized protein BCR38DRAFT_150636 [Pseudomassariella vexata]ORY67068.1 hypothetical protein BCR38DRAFT_150636 [Pseudomassariella vexata]